MLRVIFLITMAFVTAAAKPSKPPLPTPTETRQEPQQQAAPSQEHPATEYRGTEAAPLIVKIIPSVNTEPETAEQRAYRVEKAAEDRWTTIFVGLTALFTFFLFGATTGLWIVTYRLWKTTTQAVKDEGAAIKAAADTATAAHRQADISERGLTLPQQPHVLFIDCGVSTQYGASPPDKFPSKGRFRLVTVGPTPALIKFLYKELLIAPTLFAHATYKDHWTRPQIVKFQEDDQSVDSVELSKGFTTIDYIDVKSAKKSLFLICRVIYDDVFGNEHDVGYCGRAIGLDGPCVPYGGTAYNYRKVTLAQDRPKGFAHDDPEPPTSGPVPESA